MAEKLSRVESRLKNKTVAVYGFDTIGRKDDAYSRYATEKLTHELVEDGRLLIVERSRIDRLMKEQQLSMTGVIDADRAARIGKMLAVDGVVIGSIVVKDNNVEFIARVVQSESAVILGSVNVVFEKEDGGGSGDAGKEQYASSKKKKVIRVPDSKGPASLNADKTVYSSGEIVTVTYSGMPGNAHDWITLVDASRPDNQYGQWFYTQGKRSGTYSFGRVKPGLYEVRAYYNWPAGGYIVQNRIRITVK